MCDTRPNIRLLCTCNKHSNHPILTILCPNYLFRIEIKRNELSCVSTSRDATASGLHPGSVRRSETSVRYRTRVQRYTYLEAVASDFRNFPHQAPQVGAHRRHRGRERCAAKSLRVCSRPGRFKPSNRNTGRQLKRENSFPSTRTFFVSRGLTADETSPALRFTHAIANPLLAKK